MGVVLSALFLQRCVGIEVNIAARLHNISSDVMPLGGSVGMKAEFYIYKCYGRLDGGGKFIASCSWNSEAVYFFFVVVCFALLLSVVRLRRFVYTRGVWWVAVLHHIPYITCAIKWEILVYYIDEVAACRLGGKHVIEMGGGLSSREHCTMPKDVLYFLYANVCA